MSDPKSPGETPGEQAVPGAKGSAPKGAPKVGSAGDIAKEAQSAATGVAGAAQTAAQNAAQSAAQSIGIKTEHISALKDFAKDPKGFIVKVVPSKVASFLGTVVSLYTALVLQNCQAEQGFKGEYLEQLGAFKEELTANAARKEALLELIGAYEQREVGSALLAYNKELVESLEESEKLTECSEHFSELISDHADLAQNHALLSGFSEEDRAAWVEEFTFLGNCKPTAAGLKDDQWKFRSLTIDLGFRRETWDAMRRSSNKSFPNRELGIDLGTIYSRIDMISKEMEEVEKELNNNFARSMNNPQQGKVGLAFVLNDKLEDVDTDLEHKSPPPKNRRPLPTEQALTDLVNNFTTMRTNMDTNADDAYNSWATIELKIGRIKDLSQELDGLYGKALAFIEQEMKDTDKGYYPWLSNAAKPSSGGGAKKGAPAKPAENKSAVKKAPEPAKKKPATGGAKKAAPASSK
ncbi:MAG: hypothetical protein U0165_15905 [Polyangiaceae bacterium]